MKTKVIFRVWPDGAVIALFPEEPGDRMGFDCVCYEHVGQHGGADYRACVEMTRPAEPGEYDALAQELAAIGYDLEIRRRASPRALRNPAQ